MGLDQATNLAAQPIENAARPDALEQLIHDYHAPVTRLACRLLGWRGDVEDLVHDVFLAAFKKIHRFRGDASTWTWLASITINRCRSLRRRRLLHLRWLRKRDRQCEAANAAGALERDETAIRVRSAVSKLSAGDRELIVLHYLEEMTIPQICSLLNVTEKVIYVRLHRARNRLKELFGDER